MTLIPLAGVTIEAFGMFNNFVGKVFEVDTFVSSRRARFTSGGPCRETEMRTLMKENKNDLLGIAF